MSSISALTIPGLKRRTRVSEVSASTRRIRTHRLQKSSCLAADGHVVQLPSGCKLNCPEMAERWWVSITRFPFPIHYFERNNAPRDWIAFLKDFRHHWPTDNDHTYVDFVRDGITGNGEARSGNPRWRRLTEIRTRGAKSAFHFDVPGSVAKSTHAGLPWLLRIREHTGERVHFWPFDGWDIPPGRSVIAEVYPSLWNHSLTLHGFDPHQRDAYAIAAWMRTTDATGSLKQFFSPELERAEREIADVEGWILGVS